MRHFFKLILPTTMVMCSLQVLSAQNLAPHAYNIAPRHNHCEHYELLQRFQITIVTTVVAHPPSAMATPTSAKPISIAQHPAR